MGMMSQWFFPALTRFSTAMTSGRSSYLGSALIAMNFPKDVKTHICDNHFEFCMVAEVAFFVMTFGPLQIGKVAEYLNDCLQHYG